MPDEIVDVPIGNITYASLTTGSITTSTISSNVITYTTTASTGTNFYPLSNTFYYNVPEIDVEPPTQEQIAEDERRSAEYRRRSQEREAARATATERAEELLLSMLNPEQTVQYRIDQSFEVIGSLGGRYRIRRGTMGNVDALDADGERVGALCAHPSMRDGSLPTPDVQLAQMLHLTTDEADYVRTANVHSGRRPVMPAA